MSFYMPVVDFEGSSVTLASKEDSNNNDLALPGLRNMQFIQITSVSMKASRSSSCHQRKRRNVKHFNQVAQDFHDAREQHARQSCAVLSHPILSKENLISSTNSFMCRCIRLCLWKMQTPRLLPFGIKMQIPTGTWPNFQNKTKLPLPRYISPLCLQSTRTLVLSIATLWESHMPKAPTLIQSLYNQTTNAFRASCIIPTQSGKRRRWWGLKSATQQICKQAHENNKINVNNVRTILVMSYIAQKHIQSHQLLRLQA